MFLPSANGNEVEMISVEPKGNPTGFQNPRCYASGDSNCSKTISGEHFQSAALLRDILGSHPPQVSGFNWQPSKEFKVVSVNSLSANILCDRHNSALSPLDTMIAEFSKTVAEFDQILGASDLELKNEEAEFQGEDIERWMLKCLIGGVVSRNFPGQIDKNWIDILFARTQFPKGRGLYWIKPIDGTIYHSDSLRIQVWLDPETKLLLVGRIMIRGLSFAINLAEPDLAQGLQVYRPQSLIFQSQNREKRLKLRWESASIGRPILLQRAGDYEGNRLE